MRSMVLKEMALYFFTALCSEFGIAFVFEIPSADEVLL